MGEQRQRTRIDKGIYRDVWGIAATVKAGGIQRENRYLLETSLKVIKAWQDETARRAAQAGAKGRTWHVRGRGSEVPAIRGRYADDRGTDAAYRPLDCGV